jgi:hypothetical protein
MPNKQRLITESAQLSIEPTELVVLIPCISWTWRKSWEKRTRTSKWNLLWRWDYVTMCEMIANVWKERSLENVHKKLCNVHHQPCGGGWVTVVVMVCDHRCLDARRLLVLLPVPCQQHSGVLTDILVDGERKLWWQNDKKMIFHVLASWQGLDNLWMDLWQQTSVLEFVWVFVLNSFVKSNIQYSSFGTSHHWFWLYAFPC